MKFFNKILKISNKKINNLFIRSHEPYIIVILIVYSGIITFFNPSFFSFETLFDTLNSMSILLVMAVGVVVVMISGGIDLSFTSIAVVSMYYTVYLMNIYPGNIFIAFLITSIIGIVLGAINAVIISYFKLPTLIVTLATGNIFFGLLLELAPTAHIKAIPPYLAKFGEGYLFKFQTDGRISGLTYVAIFSIIILILTSIFLRFTRLGRNIYAIGGNTEAAKRSGISVVRTQFLIYCFAGFIAGVASFLHVSMFRYVNPFNLQTVMIDVIAGVVLGGALLTGGHGSILGTFLGTLLLFIIRNSLIRLGVGSVWDSFLSGIIILLGVGFTVLRERRKILLEI